MARRGRAPMSPEQKKAKKDRIAADKAQALAANALAKLPSEKEQRDELFRELDACLSSQQSAAGDVSAQKKRMHQVFGITKQAMQIRSILNKCPDGVYEATMQQVQLFMADTNRPIQLSMKLEPGKGVADDQGSIFDKTSAGEHVGAERGDDPGRASKRAGGPPPAPTPTPGIPLEEAEAKFKAAGEAAQAKREGRSGPGKPPEAKSDDAQGGAAQADDAKPTDAAAADGFEDGKDVRPRHLIEADAQRAQEEASRKAAEHEKAMKGMSAKEKAAYTKKIANEVFAKQGNKGLGPDAVH